METKEKQMLMIGANYKPVSEPGGSRLRRILDVRAEAFCNLKCLWGLPWWSVVKNPPYNGGDVGSIPGQGTKIPRAAGQLSPCAATTELARLN